ncbi:MAG: response regulator [Elusimicrobiaceae bacterium]|nr:response regulator [Elusimicrobiaceae bacterium]
MARILIVDDALFIRNILKEIALREGFEVAGEAENGREAVDKYRQLRPDVVTMDIVMPDVGGIDGGITALREILKLDPKARVIMVSAIGQHTFVTEAIKEGAKDFIVKPFQQKKVVDALRKISEDSAE